MQKGPEWGLIKKRKKVGSDLLSHLLAVPSALRGLTSLFGMVRGGPPRYSHQQIFVDEGFSPSLLR